MSTRLVVAALSGIGEVGAGDPIGARLCAAAEAAGIAPEADDVLVVSQKVVSKAEGRRHELSAVEPARAPASWATCSKRTHGSCS